MDSFERVFVIRHRNDGWVVSDGTNNIATLASQSGAIKCAAMAAVTAQLKGYTATFRIDI